MTNTAERGKPTARLLPVSRTRATTSLHVRYRKPLLYNHDLWHVEQSFRMSKTDLNARPMFHRTRDAIEAHLTVVFTALGVARFMGSS